MFDLLQHPNTTKFELIKARRLFKYVYIFLGYVLFEKKEADLCIHIIHLFLVFLHSFLPTVVNVKGRYYHQISHIIYHVI